LKQAAGSARPATSGGGRAPATANSGFEDMDDDIPF